MYKDKDMINLGLGVLLGVVGYKIIIPPPKTRRTSKEISLLKNKSEEKGYYEGYADGKKDYQPKKKKK